MKIKRLLFLFSLPLLLAACTSYKNVPYLQNPEAVNDLEGTHSPGRFPCMTPRSCPRTC